MADNYLEKKYEELRQGRPVLRRSTPSLDSLLKRACEACVPDLSYVVKQAQLDALVRSAGLADGSLSFETSETTSESAASVRIISADGAFEAGQAALAVRLKAAELALDSAVVPCQAAENSSGPFSVTVLVFRKS